MTPKEKKLIAGYIAGDKKLEEEFIREYYDKIRKTVYYTLANIPNLPPKPDIEAVKDICQTVFYLLQQNNCAKLRIFKGECSLKTWLCKIAKHAVYDYLKNNSDEINKTDSLNEKVGENQEQERGDFIPVNKPSPSEEVEINERFALAKQYLKELDRDDRRILELFHLEDLSLKQIAKLFETNEGALFMRKKRIEDEIRKRYKRDVGS